MYQELCAPLGERIAGEQIRIFNDARQAARAAFCVARRPQPKELLREVTAALRSALSKRAYVREISPHAWLYTGRMPEDQWRFQGDVIAYAEGLQDAMNTLAEEIASATHRRGGRPADERVHSFVTALAQIYMATTGKRPTYVIDPATGRASGAFGEFVDVAMHTFSRGPIPRGSVRKAIQDVAWFQRETEAA